MILGIIIVVVLGVTSLEVITRFKGGSYCRDFFILLRSRPNFLAIVQERQGNPTKMTFATFKVEFGNVDGIAVLSLGSLREQDGYGDTPLVLAARRGKEDKVAALARRGVSLRDCDGSGRNPLTSAIEEGHIGVVRNLIDLVATNQRRQYVNRPDSNGDAPLVLVARMLATDQAKKKYLIRLPQSRFGFQIRSWREDWLDIMQRLLQAGADPNKPDRQEALALRVVAYVGDVDAINLLLSARAEVDRSDVIGYSALRNAMEKGHVGAVVALKQAGASLKVCGKDGFSMLTAAVCLGRANEIRAVRPTAEELNAEDGNKNTPLMIAARNNEPKMIPELVELGADVDKYTSDDINPLLAAIEQGHLDVIRALREAGASLNVCGEDEFSVLTAAVSWNKWAEISAVKPSIEEIIKPDRRGITPVKVAEERKALETLKFLLRKIDNPLLLIRLASKGPIGAPRETCEIIQAWSSSSSEERRLGLGWGYLNHLSDDQLLEETLLPNENILANSDFRKILARYHPDQMQGSEAKAEAAEIFTRLSNIRERVQKEVEVEIRNKWSKVEKLHLIMSRVIAAARVVDTGVEMIRYYNDPTWDNGVRLLQSALYTTGAISGINKFSITASAGLVGYTLIVKKSPVVALEQGLTAYAYMLMPKAIISMGLSPHAVVAYTAVMTSYTVVSVSSNVLSLCKELSSEESRLPLRACAKVADNVDASKIRVKDTVEILVEQTLRSAKRLVTSTEGPDIFNEQISQGDEVKVSGDSDGEIEGVVT